MAAEAFRRKSQLFLNNISPVTNTYDELVKKKLETGKFPTTKTGIIKITGVLFLVFALCIFLANTLCEDTSSWYPYLLPISLGITIFVQLLLVFIFAFGATVNRPAFWIYSDLCLILLLSVNSLICSVLTYKNCTEVGAFHRLPGLLSMVGSIILVISCGAIFLMYRYNEEETHTTGPSRQQEAPRKSVFA